ncbi:putative heavy metal-associated domain, HMA, heavy metal-associated domain superfamily [Helianthus annuus]|uniref:Heavy metal-associated domain, HMA, heavy metal-associated domain superfamily n=1 Tax=Helianthus annuus TaxID=4232 RepID=A0A9K3I3L8_HELAN|nr:putative heavy metal-associated domain, HMA, heavy metal-associated domain superfamily [Helianthus annuus]KAJ0533050.1 putative heavy metal-associated domain, HMA, heavy metal-associated domain superfamily [Helianthus annuus]KAJ0541416.1 putative heavy metal-associated domain, HMA, heavy metal-associated domain superfamily [Helianthus annuus]KAJ0706496.1 putative heavy metal-associated domain, HMA, heavy metal-associated domain superfamily [Helianthus annuus]KAJ0710521.1 putative heavy metal
MHQRIELKVNMYSGKCRRNVLKSVTKLSGIDQVSVDLEKETLVIVGNVDPVSVVKRVEKTGKRADIVSVGPPKKPDPPKCEPIKIAYGHPVCTNVYPTLVAYEQPYPCESGGCVIV